MDGADPSETDLSGHHDISQLKDFLCQPPPVTYNFMPVQKLPLCPDLCLKMGICKAGEVTESHREMMAR